MKRLLLLSNSTMPGTPFFSWAAPHTADFLGARPKNLVFIPFAAVTFSFDDYGAIVEKAFSSLGYNIQSLHTCENRKTAIEQAEAIVIGGGNTFALLNRMYEEDLVPVVREKVNSGTPYIGWSAGANLACPTIKTTNDMPVVQPPSLDALGLLPLQLNPHYHELRFENQGGETRKERLNEFLVLNPDKKVIGLPEGMFVRLEGKRLIAGGRGVAKFYEYKKEIRDILPGDDLSELLPA